MNKKKDFKSQIRMPDELRMEIQRLADGEERSFSAQVRFLLKKALNTK